MAKVGSLRCAIYTRKSSEEGLEQNFNSLDAQREACEAYIKSQQHEGWSPIEKSYDDGGFSGGSMERPGLRSLLADIEGKKIDVIVVYKVDRLTRSLIDFAKMVEVFDQSGVSFVSVTQQFNTTTSMGRLTLNVLLSFAQFEREVTGERIRDKIAASKKKGMWMGGFVPLGYESKERTLVINEEEAETIKTLFNLYLKLGCVRKVKAEADKLGLTTKARPGAKSRWVGGRPFSRGHIYRILSNPLYIGEIPHKETSYPGQHDGIIDKETWETVQAQLASNGQRRRSGTRAKEPSLLVGLLFDDQGNRLTPSHALKDGKRYRYYISRPLITEAGEPKITGTRIPAHDIETLIIGEIGKFLLDKAELIEALQLSGLRPKELKATLERAKTMAEMLRSENTSNIAPIVTELVSRIEVGQDQVKLELSCKEIGSLLDAPGKPSHEQIEFTVNFSLKRYGQETKLIIDGPTGGGGSNPNPALIKAIVRGHDWFDRLCSGQTQTEIAEADGIGASFITRIIRLAFLAPDVTQAILDGTQPPSLSADNLVQRSAALPASWDQQRRTLRIES